jgi:uncharacterized protein YbjT (DUF2867 family)
MPLMAAEPVDRRTVLVTGATGRLGVLADLLLARGHQVRAMTREPSSPRARWLRGLGAEVVYGDFDDPQSIRLAAAGADAVFATGTAHRAGPAGEERHGLNLAGAALDAGVGHLVYSSGDGAAPDSRLPLFRAKFAVEERIRSTPIPHTILAPVYFMENLFNPWNLAALRSGTFPSPIPVDLPLQEVAIADVAAFAVTVIERPERFVGQRVALASDELTASQAAAHLSRVSGRHVQAQQLAADTVAPGLRALFAWLEHSGHAVEVEALHREYPQLGWHDYPSWLESERPRLSATSAA